MDQPTAAVTIRFDATVLGVRDLTVLRLPQAASRELPTRGQVAVQGAINGHAFRTVVEPDGEFGHWIKVDDELREAAHLAAGDTARLEVEPLEDWPEPAVPRDLAVALAGAAPRIQSLWRDITPRARWEWVRWVNATTNPETRERRVEVSISKMQGGKRRPCCFNLASCTDPDLSKNGRLDIALP